MSLGRRQLLSAVGTTLLGATPLYSPSVLASSGTSDVALPRADAHNTGHVQGAAPGSDLGVDWRVQFDGDVSTGPSYIDGSAYVGVEDGRVVALGVAGGERHWTTRLEDTPVLFVTGTDDRLFVPTRESTLYCLDRASGSHRWDVDMAGSALSPVTTDGETLVCGTSAGTVIAFDHSGAERWTHEGLAGVSATPAITADAVFVRDEAGVLVALDRETGLERWKRSLGRTTPPRAFRGPVVDGTHVYASAVTDDGQGTDRRRIVALDPETGRLVWERDIQQGSVFDLGVTPAYVVSFYGNGLHALDPADGREVWYEKRESLGWFRTVGDRLLFRSEDHFLTMHDAADGRELEQFEPGGFLQTRLGLGDEPKLSSGPTPFPGGFLVNTVDGAIVAVRGDSGSHFPWLVGGGLGGVGAYLAHRYRTGSS